MSPRNSEDAPVGLYRKPRSDLYTVMLVVALMALIAATIFLYFESTITGPTPPGTPSVQTGMLWKGPGAGMICDSMVLPGESLLVEASPVSG